VPIYPTGTNDDDNNPHKDMAYTSSATPIWHPIIKDIYSKLVPAPITTKPSEGGYTLGFPGTREVATQEELIKLFYARHFDVTSTELAISIGTSVLLSGDRAAYRRSKKSLTRIWRGLRLRAFGAKSPLSLLVQHRVEEFDFMSMLAKFLQLETVFNRIPVGGETAEARQIRLDKAEMYGRLSRDHIQRTDNSTAEAINTATQALDGARSGIQTTVKHIRVREATTILNTREQEKRKWKRELTALKNNTNPSAYGPFHKTYANLNLAAQQRFWAKIWSKDLAAAMLSGVKNIIDIPATLEESEDMYMTLFVVYAMDSWKYCNGVEFSNRAANIALRAAGIPGGVIEMSGEAMRSQVYANMSEASRIFFDDAPGKEFDRLRIACDASEARSKRKLVEAKFIPVINVPTKKRRT
jgi:hypothetical protein